MNEDGHPSSRQVWQVIYISQWGCVRLANKESQFDMCTHLNVSAEDVIDLTGILCEVYVFEGFIVQWRSQIRVIINGTH